MENASCPLPSVPSPCEEQVIARLLNATRIAVVGASDDPSRPGNYVPEFLLSAGKDVVPVNPKHTQVFGRPCYPSLSQVPGAIDLVNVFRRPAACVDVVKQAIVAGAKGVWLQTGIVNDEARSLAQEAGLDFVQDRCIMVELRRRRPAPRDG